MRYWIGVVPKEQVLQAVSGGFCQVCHGKVAPLKRMQDGDYLLYYSHKININDKAKYQAITAIGRITGDCYTADFRADFQPVRRPTSYQPVLREFPLALLKQHPDWQAYASQLRFGFFEISQSLFDAIYQHMTSDHAH